MNRTDLELLHNTVLYRPGVREPDYSYCSNRWARPIDHLLAARYTFLPCRYSSPGHLFRGMQTGITTALRTGSFGYFDGDDELCAVERTMEVFFITHELSDAITVSALHTGISDGGIVVMKSGLFNRSLAAGKAAVLGIGDGGIVFRYPFLCEPLSSEMIDCVLMNASSIQSIPTHLQESCRLIPIPGNTKAELEREMIESCGRLGLLNATPQPWPDYPRRH